MKQYSKHITFLFLRMKSQTLLLAFLFSLSAFLGTAQVTSSVDSTSIKIGEEIKYSIQVEAD